MDSIVDLVRSSELPKTFQIGLGVGYMYIMYLLARGIIHSLKPSPPFKPLDPKSQKAAYKRALSS